MFLRNPSPRQVFHPIPIALGEICKLCEIDGSAGIGHRELIGQSCRIPSLRGIPSNANALASDRVTSAGPTRPTAKCVAVLIQSRLNPPDFELLSPAVVIRRRPQRR